MAVNYQYLRTFHAVAVDGNISQAARRLNISQPTLSKQLKALEDRYKLSLFENRTPPLKLTATGEALFAQTRHLFHTTQTIEALLGEPDLEDSLILRIGSDSPPLTARLAMALKTRMPTLQLRAHIANARDAFEMLRTAQVDVAILSDPPVHTSFYYVPVSEDHLMAALPADHPRASAERFDLNWVTDEVLLLREPSSRTRSAIERCLINQGLTAKDSLVLHTRETIREGIAVGLGISFFYSSECPPDPRIRYLPLQSPDAAANLTAYLVCLSERRHLTVIRRAFEVMHQS